MIYFTFFTNALTYVACGIPPGPILEGTSFRYTMYFSPSSSTGALHMIPCMIFKSLLST